MWQAFCKPSRNDYQSIGYKLSYAIHNRFIRSFLEYSRGKAGILDEHLQYFADLLLVTSSVARTFRLLRECTQCLSLCNVFGAR